MPLEDDIAKHLHDAVARTTPMLEAAVNGPHVATPDAILGSMMEIQRAQRVAILRLAREIDELRATLEGGDGDG